MMEQLHLLRPEALWALIPVGIVVLLLRRRQDAASRWKAVIAPHLLQHLVVRPKRRFGIRPIHALTMALLLMVLALAGPTWQQEPSPFTEDTAPMVIALELTPRMLVNDVQPSRLERAKLKIRDLAEARGGSRTALLAYAGSGHTVMPLTDDPAALTAFVMDLEPDVMPVSGNRPQAALELTAELLDRDATPGTVLFVTSGIPELSFGAFAEFEETRRDQVQLLVMATKGGGTTPEGEFSSMDRTALDAFGAATRAVVTLFTVDDSDIGRVQNRTQRHLASVQQENPEGRWRDEGWWLTWPIAAIALLWFRRGWTIRWEA